MHFHLQQACSPEAEAASHLCVCVDFMLAVASPVGSTLVCLHSGLDRLQPKRVSSCLVMYSKAGAVLANMGTVVYAAIRHVQTGSMRVAAFVCCLAYQSCSS